MDLKPAFQAKGIPPSLGDSYTVPAIFDPATGQAVSDSVRIAEYLDSQVPPGAPLYIVPATNLAALSVPQHTISVPIEHPRSTDCVREERQAALRVYRLPARPDGHLRWRGRQG